MRAQESSRALWFSDQCTLSQAASCPDHATTSGHILDLSCHCLILCSTTRKSTTLAVPKSALFPMICHDRGTECLTTTTTRQVKLDSKSMTRSSAKPSSFSSHQTHQQLEVSKLCTHQLLQPLNLWNKTRTENKIDSANLLTEYKGKMLGSASRCFTIVSECIQRN